MLILSRNVPLSDLDLRKLPRNTLSSPALSVPELEIIGVTADAINDGLGNPILPSICVNHKILLSPKQPSSCARWAILGSTIAPSNMLCTPPATERSYQLFLSNS
jgi:hypothetical protein